MRFEEALKRLEEIVGKLEGEDLCIDESLTLYEEGTRLLKECHGKLNEAKQRIEVLTKELDGTLTPRPFLEENEPG